MLERLFVTKREHKRLAEMIQRVQAAQAATPSVFDSDDVIDRIAARVAAKLSREGAEAAIAVEVGRAIEAFAAAMRRPLRRDLAGGRARARSAWRYADGTFMSEGQRTATIEEFEIADYERYAAGGRARARSAQRWPDGTFASNKDYA